MARDAQIQFRRDTAANWTSVNPTLAAGELGFETDTNKFKIGNGSSTWTALAYASASGAVAANDYYKSQHATTTTLELFDRTHAITNASSGASTAFFAMFTPVKDITVSNISMLSGSPGSSGLTLARLGLYTWDDSTDTGTLVARTASDTTLFFGSGTVYTRAFNTTGGYPASYALTAGNRYAVAVIQVGTTPAALNAASGLNVNLTSLAPRITGHMTGQTDLPTSASSLTANTFFPWTKLS